MSKRSRLTDDSSSSASSTSKKRLVSVATVDNWVLDHDKTLNTATWITYEKFDRHHLALLRCSVCKRFEERIKKSRNFSPAFIDGTSNLRTSSFKLCTVISHAAESHVSTVIVHHVATQHKCNIIYTIMCCVL